MYKKNRGNEGRGIEKIREKIMATEEVGKKR